MNRNWITENGGIWQIDSHRIEPGADMEIRRHLVCRVGDELALAFDVSTRHVVKFGPRSVIEHWIGEANRAPPVSHHHATVSILTFLASPETVGHAIQCWEQNADVRLFAEHLRGTDRIRYDLDRQP